jgi:phosphoribosylformylglycinamidine (FGAM) synthase-like enzyme
VVGGLDDASKVVARAFRAAGEDVVLLGDGSGELGGSEYLKVLHQLVKGRPPELDLDRERRLIDLLVRAASAGILRSAHDCSDGGVAVTIAECAFDTGGIGCDVDIARAKDGHVTGAPIDQARALFGESASRAIVSVRAADRAALMALAAAAGVPAKLIGTTGGSRIVIRAGGQPAIELSVEAAERTWSTSIGRHFRGRAA